MELEEGDVNGDVLDDVVDDVAVDVSEDILDDKPSDAVEEDTTDVVDSGDGDDASIDQAKKTRETR